MAGKKRVSGSNEARSAPSDSVMGAGEGSAEADRTLGDFTITWRTVQLLPLAVVIGILAAAVALGLLDLIGLITHVAYYGNVGISLVAPTFHHWGALAVAIPVLGGLAVGVMARFGSEQIRGHGIPEAMETILTGGSRVQPRLAVLKPISSAISIGSGGPFGAEGPIILTGGAVGSVLAQLFRLAAIERRTLLVAGSCAGMAAVFGTPVAAALFGVELLVFEWRPRSFVPIAIAVAVAEVVRNVFAGHHLMMATPLFPVPAHGAFSSVGVGESAIIGVAAGILALVLTTACYGAEDLFKKLPIHWMWWPPIGGLVVGLGGLIDPKALGVGYGVIGAELAGKLALASLALLLVVKLVIWSVALGLGDERRHPGSPADDGRRPRGHHRARLRRQQRHVGADGHGRRPRRRDPVAAHLHRLRLRADARHRVAPAPARRLHPGSPGQHPHPQALDPDREGGPQGLSRHARIRRRPARGRLRPRGDDHRHADRGSGHPCHAASERSSSSTRWFAGSASTRSSPATRLTGVIGWSDLSDGRDRTGATVDDLAHHDAIVAYPDETLRSAADRMAAHELGALVVVDRSDRSRLLGVVTYFELLGGRRRQLVEEHHRQRPLRLRLPAAEPTGDQLSLQGVDEPEHPVEHRRARIAVALQRVEQELDIACRRLPVRDRCLHPIHHGDARILSRGHLVQQNLHGSTAKIVGHRCSSGWIGRCVIAQRAVSLGRCSWTRRRAGVRESGSIRWTSSPTSLLC